MVGEQWANTSGTVSVYHKYLVSVSVSYAPPTKSEKDPAHNNIISCNNNQNEARTHAERMKHDGEYQIILNRMSDEALILD
jgi:hypothetical protein